jgi:hypothetical protein
VVCGFFGIATCKSSRGDEPERGLFQTRILKDRAERGASAVCERVRPALAIVCDESPDGHGLHRMGENADRGVVNAGRGTEQNHSVLCAEFGGWLCHGLRQFFANAAIAGASARSRACGVPAMRRGGGGGFGGLGGSMRTNPFPVMAAPASAASDLTILHRRGPPISQ